MDLEVSDRDRVEEALRQSEARYRRIAANAPPIVIAGSTRCANVPEPDTGSHPNLIAKNRISTVTPDSGLIVVGFASQRTLGNFVAGLLIAFTQPLRLGDAVVIEPRPSPRDLLARMVSVPESGLKSGALSAANSP